MKKQELTSRKHIKANRKNRKEKNADNNPPDYDPRTAHKDEPVTNGEQQNEIVNEPNYKTDREEEIKPEDPGTSSGEQNNINKKELPEAEA